MNNKIKKIIKKKNKTKIICLTAYSKNIAELIDNHADIVLVGDSLGSVLYNYDTTKKVTLKMMIEHTKSVRMGVKKSLLIIDLPYNTYRNKSEALKNSKKVIKETKCDAVKIEGGTRVKEIVRHLVKNKIPVLGHIGITPQTAKGKFKSKGRSEVEKKKLIKDARALEDSGVFGIVLECVYSDISKKITNLINVPTIGIGASVATSDLTDLRAQFNAYSSTTGISAQLSADKASLMLVQDEGLDIVIENVDFAGVTTNVDTTRFVATAMDQAQATSGTSVSITDSSYTTAVSDSFRASGIVTFHSSQSFSIVPANPNGGLFESTAIASSLNKVSTINVTTMAGAVDALKVVDRALDRVHMERAKFGALMSRMNVVIDNLTTISQSQRASKSRILDADFARESSRLAKSQILQQSAMNMIAQASRTMQNVLVLFQG